METNRQKKMGALLQGDLVDILQGEVRKNGISNLIISSTVFPLRGNMLTFIRAIDKSAEILTLVTVIIAPSNRLFDSNCIISLISFCITRDTFCNLVPSITCKFTIKN